MKFFLYSGLKDLQVVFNAYRMRNLVFGMTYEKINLLEKMILELCRVCIFRNFN